jgi:hypothetical protein
MAKWADYFISGVWKDNAGDVTHVMLHEVNEKNEYKKGEKNPLRTVINLINRNKLVMTITWGYPGWKKGALVTVVSENGKEYLRTVANATEKDNLDNSLQMKDFII